MVCTIVYSHFSSNFSGDLFLVPQLHRDVAILVLKAALQYVPDATGNTAMISEGLKQVGDGFLLDIYYHCICFALTVNHALYILSEFRYHQW